MIFIFYERFAQLDCPGTSLCKVPQHLHLFRKPQEAGLSSSEHYLTLKITLAIELGFTKVNDY
jgi:hypothetical protein